MISVIIPFGSEDPDRIRAWIFVHDWWCANFPDWQILKTDTHPFNKARAVNLGAKAVSSSVLVIADADCFVDDPLSLRKMVENINQWVVPHRVVYRMTPQETENVYNGHPPMKGYKHSVGCIGGGIVALTRSAWDTVNGMDERYEGWGGEDVSFGMALQCLVGPEQRGSLDLFHLWHKPSSINYQMPDKSTRLIQEYRKARRHPDKMKELING